MQLNFKIEIINIYFQMMATINHMIVLHLLAPTYGEHREKLELDKDGLITLKEDCRKYNVDFMSTPFDEPSLDHLIDIDVDVIKKFPLLILGI